MSIIVYIVLYNEHYENVIIVTSTRSRIGKRRAGSSDRDHNRDLWERSSFDRASFPRFVFKVAFARSKSREEIARQVSYSRVCAKCRARVTAGVRARYSAHV